jgi:hypothetical protein
MKTIAALIDYTEGSKIALRQAVDLAKKTQARVCALHVVTSQDKVADAERNLQSFVSAHTATPVETHIGVGGLINAAQSTLKKLTPDLVIICTHGVKGVMQHLFGAQILKLVQGITYPCLVVQENTHIDLSELNSILLPIGPHPDFMVKIIQTASLAKAIGASIIIYEIDRPSGDFEDQLAKNSQMARDYFRDHGVNYSRVVEDVQVISVGYSRQTIEYARNNKINLLSLMASVSKNDILFGSGDKESFLVNEQGVCILTCNS